MSWYDQALRAYWRMHKEARYRPAAPSDGMGNVTCPVSALDLATEAQTYAREWRTSEDLNQYWVGCPSYPDRETLIFIIEAARLLCGVERDGALALLRMAVANLEKEKKQP